MGEKVALWEKLQDRKEDVCMMHDTFDISQLLVALS